MFMIDSKSLSGDLFVQLLFNEPIGAPQESDNPINYGQRKSHTNQQNQQPNCNGTDAVHNARASITAEGPYGYSRTQSRPDQFFRTYVFAHDNDPSVICMNPRLG